MEHRSSLNAVVFDLFGTLVDFESDEVHEIHRTEMASLFGVSIDQFRHMWSKTMAKRDLGCFHNTAGDIRNVARLLGVQLENAIVEQAVQLRYDFYKRYLKPRAGAVETLNALRSRDYKTGLITVCGTEVPEVWGDTPLAPLFDACIFSCLESLTKPDPRIYLLTCEQLSVPAKECMYVGDGSYQELAGALAVGMFPIMIERGVKGPRNDYGNVEEWSGPRISHLHEVIELLGGRNKKGECF